MKTIYTRLLLVSFLFLQLIRTQGQNCWSSLGSGGNNIIDVYALTPYNGNLIVGGGFDTIGGIIAHGIASWNGTSFSTLSSGLGTTYSQGHRLFTTAIYNGDLYAAGVFDSIGGVAAHSIAKWNGTSWSALGDGITGEYPPYVQVNAMIVYNGALYVAGEFDSAGGIFVSSIAKWDGTSWSPLASGIANSHISLQESIFSLGVNNGTLYASGSFKSAGAITVNNVAAWNGTTWSALGAGFDSAGVTALTSYQGDLYAAVAQGPYYYIKKWNGSVWTNVVGGPGNNYYGFVYAFFPFNGNLLATGQMNVTVNSTPLNTGIAQWNGSSWSELSALAGDSGAIDPLAIYNTHLYAGGGFTHIGNVNAQSVAEYTCATSGIAETTKSKISVYPNPSKGIITVMAEDISTSPTIMIYDLMGARIFQSALTKNKTEVDLRGQVNGTYLYHMSGSNGESIESGIFVIE